MRSYRFMLSRRWALFAVVVVLLAWGAWWLGDWQFGRLHDRQHKNSIVRTNEHRPPIDAADLLTTSDPVTQRDEWRRVTATGTYDDDATVIVRYRNNDDGAAGVDVVVPLITGDGTALAVDRGFLKTDAPSVAAGDVPAPPSGSVTVTGWLRVDGTGDSTQVDDLSTRAISSARLGEAWNRPTYRGFVDLISEDPASDTRLEGTSLPELNNGPHFFYGLQWWFFGVLAVVGFFYLAYDERRRGPRGARSDTGSPAADSAPAARPTKERKPRQTNVNAAYQRPRKTKNSRD